MEEVFKRDFRVMEIVKKETEKLSNPEFKEERSIKLASDDEELIMSLKGDPEILGGFAKGCIVTVDIKDAQTKLEV